MKQIYNTIIDRSKILAAIFRTLAFTMGLMAVAVSCDKNIPEENNNGVGNVRMNIRLNSSDSPRTSKEGNVMKNLNIWIVKDDTGVILKYKKLTHETQDDESFFADDGKTAEVRFIDIERGDCVLYAVANYDKIDTEKYAEGSTIDSDFQNILLDEIKDGEEPAFSDVTGMPCSVVYKFSVGAGENRVNAHLLRCVGKLSIYAKNHIDYSAAFFKSVGLSKHNPSSTYLFHKNGQIPPGSQNVSFTDIDGLVKVDAKTAEPVLIYETYMYETDPTVDAGTITFELFGAIYRDSVTEDEVKIDYRKEYSFDTNNNFNDMTLSDAFLIRSGYSNNYYMGDDDHLTAKFFSGDTELKHHYGIENYFWKVSANASGTQDTYTFTNIGTGRQLSLSNTTAKMVENGNGTPLGISLTTNGVRLQNNYYWLTIDADKGIYGNYSRTTPSSSNTLWMTRKVTEVPGGGIPYFSNSNYEIPRAKRELTYIDNYGVTRNLVSISRNDHLEMIINIFYNRELGELNFTVEPWRERNSETTFD